MVEYVVSLDKLGVHDVEHVGGKNASLGEMISNLAGAGVSVPGGFATTAQAYRDFLEQSGLNDRIHAALDALEPGQPLDPQERSAVEADLADLAVYEALLAHKGIRGLVVCCDECQQDHYHDWDMLRANLLQLLVDGTVRPHEPAYDPEPDAYVTWDYCRGYADASLNEATSDYDGLR